VITLTLLHPIRFTPIQSWEFSSASVIGIGRATNNDVVLYSSVVSRHHVQLRQNETQWEIINLGANGTYVDGQPITKMPLANNTVIYLAKSGPRILLRLGIVEPNTVGKIASGQRSLQSQMPDLATSKMTFLTNRIIQKLEGQKPSDRPDEP
jgi:pSer/pThr/pTyr-binding forkhead associated (FHA) protein